MPKTPSTGELYAGVGAPPGIPPLYSLMVFASAARCGSFSAAAKELCVTQSAVSRQVQQLEEYLGVTLFSRHKRGLRLTVDADALFPVVEEAFGRVTRACDRLQKSGQVLTLRMPPTLAIRWFLPRLPSLQYIMPGVDVRVTTYEAREVPQDGSDVDASIIYGLGPWPSSECVRLMNERLTPVCTPDMARSLKQPDDLQHVPLLQCEPIQSWSRWLDAAGVAWAATHRQTFDTLEFALTAATRGQGVALGDLSLLTESLTNGILVAPFECVIERGMAYYLLYPPERATIPKIRALREWLIAAAA